MFEFKKICDAYENLTPVEKGVILTEKSIKLLAVLSALDIPEIDPAYTLAGFIIGSAVCDGKLNEQEYLLIYPALVKTFGSNFDFNSVKESFNKDKLGRKIITEYTQDMLSILDCLDDELKTDVIILCLCIVSLDGKITPKEKKYIKRLCKA